MVIYVEFLMLLGKKNIKFYDKKRYNKYKKKYKNRLFI